MSNKRFVYLFLQERFYALSSIAAIALWQLLRLEHTMHGQIFITCVKCKSFRKVIGVIVDNAYFFMITAITLLLSCEI